MMARRRQRAEGVEDRVFERAEILGRTPRGDGDSKDEDGRAPQNPGARHIGPDIVIKEAFGSRPPTQRSRIHLATPACPGATSRGASSTVKPRARRVSSNPQSRGRLDAPFFNRSRFWSQRRCQRRFRGARAALVEHSFDRGGVREARCVGRDMRALWDPMPGPYTAARDRGAASSAFLRWLSAGFGGLGAAARRPSAPALPR